MNTTNVDSLAVVSIACFSSDSDRRRRASAMISAPVAPIAPPSVGVATPRKMVPSTRKISASGGIITNVTRSAIFDKRPSFNTRFRTAAKNATPAPTDVETTMVSSSARSAHADLGVDDGARNRDDRQHQQRAHAACAVVYAKVRMAE